MADSKRERFARGALVPASPKAATFQKHSKPTPSTLQAHSKHTPISQHEPLCWVGDACGCQMLESVTTVSSGGMLTRRISKASSFTGLT